MDLEDGEVSSCGVHTKDVYIGRPGTNPVMRNTVVRERIDTRLWMQMQMGGRNSGWVDIARGYVRELNPSQFLLHSLSIGFSASPY